MLSLDYSVLNASAYSVPQSFLHRVLALAFKQSTKQHLNLQEIPNFLQKAVTEEWRDLQTLGTKILRILASEQGFVVVKNLPFCNYQRPIIDYFFTQ